MALTDVKHVTVWRGVQGPEIFFNPEIFSSDFTVSLPDVVDESILKVPPITIMICII